MRKEITLGFVKIYVSIYVSRSALPVQRVKSRVDHAPLRVVYSCRCPLRSVGGDTHSAGWSFSPPVFLYLSAKCRVVARSAFGIITTLSFDIPPCPRCEANAKKVGFSWLFRPFFFAIQRNEKTAHGCPQVALSGFCQNCQTFVRNGLLLSDVEDDFAIFPAFVIAVLVDDYAVALLVDLDVSGV